MLVLDTHILLWFIQDNKKLTKPQRNKIEDHIQKQQKIMMSSISIWEICMLAVKGRLMLNTDIESFINQIQQLPWLTYIPVNNHVAIESTRLPGNFHKDPADRMIVALARTKSSILITADEKILKYPHVETVI